MTSHAAPPMWRPKAEVAKKSKWLIVEADYMALTCRIDPNVIFWARGVARSDSIIPKDVTDLWISDFVDRAVRLNLIDQALKRNLNIWWNRDDHRAIPILSLREKLLDVWGDPANRSMVYPAVPEFDEPTESFAAERKKETLEDRIKRERAETLREAGKRAAAGQAEVAAKRESRIKQVLAQLPVLDRKVYEFYLQNSGANGDRITITVTKFGLPRVSIEDIVKQVEEQLEG